MTREYTYDAAILRDYYIEKLKTLSNVTFLYNASIEHIKKRESSYEIALKKKVIYESPFILNATYASTNQIFDMLGYEKFKIKYELCEIILCDVNERMKEYGFTVMDGPFFSIMPFGMTGIHSLTSVTFGLSNPIRGWTSNIMFISFAFFGLFAILTIIIRYLQILLTLSFKRRSFTFESIEKIME